MKSDLAVPGSSVQHRFQSLDPSGPLQAQYASDGPSWFDQPSMTLPPPYMTARSGYYLTESPGILSNPTSISPQLPAIGMPKPAYPSPESKAATDPDEPVKVLSPRRRPQCWDHGCNGRKFSTFSNLLRHQRQKLGIIAKSECPICGANFTRPTARNIHVEQGKCKFSDRKSSAT
ncbi:hypothetical protein N7455_007578 [Penicillium solitum]|uniref:uncharacterized protein n=1 Tax=Penicillium solitum TaxID=60172 RepID=UPI0032C43E85|nr:hypothetical protein N7455_007578 [Penicillium solitum]